MRAISYIFALGIKAVHEWMLHSLLLGFRLLLFASYHLYAVSALSSIFPCLPAIIALLLHHVFVGVSHSFCSQFEKILALEYIDLAVFYWIRFSSDKMIILPKRKTVDGFETIA